MPTPFTDQDRAGGYWWELSMRQVEVSRTLVLDDPRRARRFFEALVADNVGVGRPEEVAVVFARQIRRSRDHRFRTRFVRAGHRGEEGPASARRRWRHSDNHFKVLGRR